MRAINAYGFRVTGPDAWIAEVEEDLNNPICKWNWKNFRNGDVVFNSNGEIVGHIRVNCNDQVVVVTPPHIDVTGEQAIEILQNLESRLNQDLWNSIEYMLLADKDQDNERFRVNYGCATTAGWVLRTMGHDVSIGTYMEDGRERLGYLSGSEQWNPGLGKAPGPGERRT